MLALGLSISTATQVVCLRHRGARPQPAGRLYRAHLVRPQRLVRHRRLRRRARAEALVRRARSCCRSCSRWPSSPCSPRSSALVILRRRGVYFALLTLALVALTYAIAFRWTALTGGEDGLGGLKRGGIAAVPLDNGVVYYACRRADRPRRALRAAARDALAVRPRAGGDPREPAARDVPGLRRRPLPAGGVRALGGGDRPRRRAARLPQLPRLGGGGVGGRSRANCSPWW